VSEELGTDRNTSCADCCASD